MDAFFSVNAQQAARSGFNAYDADAGIKDVYLGLNADIPLSQQWSLKMTGMYSRLIGDAADSPIVESEDQFFGGLGLTYRFSFQR
jgi:outer membrane scaffolding protein for murein synthesis (MipA/OmpV family)